MAKKSKTSTPARREPYLGLARKYRPQTFQDLIGQDAVAHSLVNAISGGRLAHAHLLAGPRGVGKTTSARILARALNCEQGPVAEPCGECRHCREIAAGHHLDVIEMDAASSTGVDNMRELLEGTVRSPFSARYKVYIIDEVHMLSVGAFNALLKTLEEPPEHVVFIFATTEFERIPETVRSRCVIHNFRRLSTEDIVLRLEQVARGEGIKLEADEARKIFSLIARAVDGGMRDALVALDQLLALGDGKPTAADAEKLLGLSSAAMLARTVECVANKDAAGLLEMIDEMVAQGRSLERYVKSLLAYLHDVMVLQAVPESRAVALEGEALDSARAHAAKLSPAVVFNLMNQLLQLEERLKQSSQGRLLLEFMFLRAVSIHPIVPVEDVIERLGALPGGSGDRSARPGGDRDKNREAMKTGSSAATASTTPSAMGSGQATVTVEPVSAEASGQATRGLSSPRGLEGALAAQPSVVASAGPALAFSDSEPQVRRGEGDGDGDTDSAEILTQGPKTDPGSLEGKEGDALVDLLAANIEPAQQFLIRYLRSALNVECRRGVMHVTWAKNDLVGQRMIGRAENKRALEALAESLEGRTVRVESVISDRPLKPRAVPSPDPMRDPGAPQTTVLQDSGAMVAEIGIGEDYASGSRSSEVYVESRALSRTSGRADAPSAEKEPEAPAPIELVTEQGSREIMAADPEFAQRARLVKDFFEGSFVDGRGRTLSI